MYHSCQHPCLSRRQGSDVLYPPSLCYTILFVHNRVQSHESITFASSHKLAPTPSVSRTPQLLDDTQLGFRAHMLSFRDRIASMHDRSPAAGGLDISNIHTPVSCHT